MLIRKGNFGIQIGNKDTERVHCCQKDENFHVISAPKLQNKISKGNIILLAFR